MYFDFVLHKYSLLAHEITTTLMNPAIPVFHEPSSRKVLEPNAARLLLSQSFSVLSELNYSINSRRLSEYRIQKVSVVW